MPNHQAGQNYCRYDMDTPTLSYQGIGCQIEINKKGQIQPAGFTLIRLGYNFEISWISAS
jgi:hypothetical protein